MNSYDSSDFATRFEKRTRGRIPAQRSTAQQWPRLGSVLLKRVADRLEQRRGLLARALQHNTTQWQHMYRIFAAYRRTIE